MYSQHLPHAQQTGESDVRKDIKTCAKSEEEKRKVLKLSQFPRARNLWLSFVTSEIFIYLAKEK